MSTPIQVIRSLIQDQPVFQSETIALLAGQTVFQTKYQPIDSTTVIITPSSSFTVVGQTGRITFAVAPGAISIVVQYDVVLLTDQSIQDMLDLDTDADPRMVAALCLDAVASQQALIQKRIKMLDLETDGPALAKALREHAMNLREDVIGEQEPVFDIAEEIYDIPGLNEKILKDWMREDL